MNPVVVESISLEDTSNVLQYNKYGTFVSVEEEFYELIFEHMGSELPFKFLYKEYSTLSGKLNTKMRKHEETINPIIKKAKNNFLPKALRIIYFLKGCKSLFNFIANLSIKFCFSKNFVSCFNLSS